MELIEKALIAEIFKSIQGEGPNLGTPAIFVRLWGCNLRCTFNSEGCDTPYAVSKGKPELMNLKNIVNKIKSLKCPHIIFTGGEPLLYQDQIIKVLGNLKKSKTKYTTEVETNGTIIPKPRMINLIDYFNISVKLESSNQQTKEYENKRINYMALGKFPASHSCFKFVWNGKKDYKEIFALHAKYPSFKVYIMPQGTSRDEIIKNSPTVVQFCIKYNFQLSPREHLIIWDGKRGV